VDNALKPLQTIAFKAERFLKHRSLASRLPLNDENPSLRYAGAIPPQIQEMIRNLMETSKVAKRWFGLRLSTAIRRAWVDFAPHLSSEPDFDLQSVSLAEIGTHQGADAILLGSHLGKECHRDSDHPEGASSQPWCHRYGMQSRWRFDFEDYRGRRERLRRRGGIGRRTGAGNSNCAVWFGLGSKASSLHVRGTGVPILGHGISVGQRSCTIREREVLTMLVAGCTNKEIAAPLEIKERTVKAHVAKLMRKVGMPNRIMLSVHAFTHSLVAPRNN
jgi:DNA-binding CsgD family transcriptional regulator